MNRLFELLFKYPQVVFEKGELTFRYGSPVLLPAAALLLFLFSHLAYTTKRRSRQLELMLAATRALALLLLVFCLLRPVLLVPSVIPQRSFVAILYDDSKSMTIKDADQHKPRIDAVRELVSGTDLLNRLSDKFQLSFFKFDDRAERIKDVSAVRADGEHSNLEAAVRAVLAELSSVPLSGIVIFTDGADNRSKRLTELARELKAKNVPLYPVGVGSEKLSKDIEVVRVSAPRSILKDSVLMADVAVLSAGYAGRRALLRVKEDDRIIHSQSIALGSDGEVTNHKVSFVPTTPGPHLYSFTIEPEIDEVLSENNSTEALLRVDDARVKILYIEGEPRWEYKFLLRALSEDKNVIVASLVRTGKKEQFYRQGLESKEELAEGFPKRRSELYKYKGLIFGSIEASFFTFDQLKMVQEFVSERGGGFLMLGSRRSFSEGGYVGTPIEKLLPVALSGKADAARTALAAGESKLQLTEYGRLHPITRLSLDEGENSRLWENIPPLRLVNTSYATKPGATSLLAVSLTGGGRMLAALSFQRYGRGRAVSLLAENLWLWRMQTDHRNKAFETFWRQLLRWLTASAYDHVLASVEREMVSPGEDALITADLYDDSFVKQSEAKVTAQVVAPSGKSEEIRLDWSPENDGSYRGRFRPTENGIHTVHVRASLAGGKGNYSGSTEFKVGRSNLEYHNPTLNRELLRRIARESGGRYYDLRDAKRIPDEIIYTKNSASIVEEKELWDMPAIFLLFIVLLSFEWFVRKSSGMA